MIARRHALLFLLILFSAVFAAAAKEFVMPAARDARGYPAHDEHPAELVTVAADPYDTPEKASIFQLGYHEYGFLPIFVVISNRGDQPVSFTDLKARLETAHRDRMEPATIDDLQRRISHTPRSGGDEPPVRTPVPLPLPRKSPRKTTATMRNEFDSAMFRAKAVEPHATQAGFLFFDIQGIREPLAGAHLYVSGLRDNNGQELIFFDIPLDKYLAEKSK